MRRTAQLAKQFSKVRFMDWLYGGKLESMGMFPYPSHDGCLNDDGAAFLGDLQDQMMPFTDFERNVAE